MARRAAGRWVIALALSGAAAASDEAPSLELLLHLAEFADAEGQPIDPQGVAEAMDVAEADAAPAHAAPADPAEAQREPPRDPGPDAAKPRERATPPAREDDDED